MIQRRCPACRQPFRKPLRPAGALGAAAYLQFCPHCLRELVTGPGLKVRLALVVAIVVAWAAGGLDLGVPVVSVVLRVLAGAALLAAWFWLPDFVAGPRRFNEDTGMAEELPG